MIPIGGNNPPIDMAEINAEFGYGNNLGSYRGQIYYNPDNSTGTFPNSNLSFSFFRGKAKNSPVIPGNTGNIYSGSSVTLPTMFNKLYVTCYAGGGGGGQGGNCTKYGTVYNGNSGYPGNPTYFMPNTSYYVGASLGGGGGGGSSVVFNAFGQVAAGGNGANGAAGSGGNGGAGGSGGNGSGGPFSNGQTGIYVLNQYGSAGGNGGVGGYSGEILIMDRNVMGFSAIQAFYGATVPIVIGAGGAGGSGGYNAGYPGNNGSGGWIYIRWT